MLPVGAIVQQNGWKIHQDHWRKSNEVPRPKDYLVFENQEWVEEEEGLQRSKIVAYLNMKSKEMNLYAKNWKRQRKELKNIFDNSKTNVNYNNGKNESCPDATFRVCKLYIDSQ